MLRRAGTASKANLISFQRRLEARIAAGVVIVTQATEVHAVVSNAWLTPSRDAPDSARGKNLEV